MTDIEHPRNKSWCAKVSAGEAGLNLILPSWVGWRDNFGRLTRLHITKSGWTTLCGVRIGWWQREGLEFAVDVDYFGPHARTNNVCKRCMASSDSVVSDTAAWFTE